MNAKVPKNKAGRRGKYPVAEVKSLREEVKARAVRDDPGAQYYKFSTDALHKLVFEGLFQMNGKNETGLPALQTIRRFFMEKEGTPGAGIGFQTSTWTILQTYASVDSILGQVPGKEEERDPSGCPANVKLDSAFGIKSDHDIVYDMAKISRIDDQLNQLYRQDTRESIEQGLREAREARSAVGPHPVILKHLFRFELRDYGYKRIRDAVESAKEELQTAKEIGLPEDLKKWRAVMFELVLFESDFSEIRYRISNQDSGTKLNKIWESKERHLDNIREEMIRKADDGSYYRWAVDYFGWLGRYFLDIWWLGNHDNALLYTAEQHLRKAVKISMSPAVNYNAWWLQCYLCIVLKLLKNADFPDHVALFVKTMNKLTTDPKRMNQASVKIFNATALALTGNAKRLKAYLENTRNTTSDFSSTIRYHLDLIYSLKSPEEQRIENPVRTMVDSWLEQ